MSPLKLAALLCVAATAARAAAPPVPIAVFPFQLQDTSGEGASPAQAARLAAATQQLAEALRHTGHYAPVDLAPYAKQIATLQPPDECGECWARLAARAGARMEVLPQVHKVSTLISLMALWFADVGTMQYTAHISGQIRGDTTEAYTRGINFLVSEELDKKPAGPVAPP